MADLSFPEQDGLSRFISDTKPRHFILKLQLFSQLVKSNIESYTSSEFEAGGYKWKLILHPNGNKNEGITDHISLYLSISESNTFDPCWEIRAVFHLFLLDQKKRRYLSLQDTAENGRLFDRMKLEWGFDKFIPLAAFKNSANGYLVNDTCVFGAEVYVCQEKLTGKGECFSMIKDAFSDKNTWRFTDFSSSTEGYIDSKPFNAGDHKWKIRFYPMGKGTGAGSYISLYLSFAEPENLPPPSKMYAEVKLRILDQRDGVHQSMTGNFWFCRSNSTRGWERFVTRGYFYSSYSGLLVNNICAVEAEVKVHAVVNAL